MRPPPLPPFIHCSLCRKKDYSPGYYYVNKAGQVAFRCSFCGRMFPAGFDEKSLEKWIEALELDAIDFDWVDSSKHGGIVDRSTLAP